MVLFLGTEAALDTTDFSPEAPAFYVGVPRESEAPVRRHFSTSRVYYLGSQTGCGCGFEYGDLDADAYPEAATSRQRLADLLRALLDAGHPAEVYACWSGDEAADADHRSRVRPEAVLDPAAVRERHHLVVTDSP